LQVIILAGEGCVYMYICEWRPPNRAMDWCNDIRCRAWCSPEWGQQSRGAGTPAPLSWWWTASGSAEEDTYVLNKGYWGPRHGGC